ncbi:MAG: hypothetical protein K6G80_11295, partial [Treponema sp.]|nr:hypothetical protein [Treponema sp.]
MEKTGIYSGLKSEEQGQVQALCAQVIFLANKARREGILSLEDGLDELTARLPGKTGLFFKALLSQVVDGVDGALIARLADNYTFSSCGSDFARFLFELT